MPVGPTGLSSGLAAGCGGVDRSCGFPDSADWERAIMKKDIHPKWYPECKVIYDGKEVMTVGATVPEMRVEIWSGSHPFYTGKSSFVDTAGRVDKFQRKFGSAGDYFKKGKDTKKAK